jgi:hypothetical protein
MDDEDGFRTQRTQDKPSGNVLLTLARDNLALWIPIIGVLIFAVRCLSVSEGDGYVASILVAETSIGDAIRTLVLVVVSLLLITLCIAAAFVASKRVAALELPGSTESPEWETLMWVLGAFSLSALCDRRMLVLRGVSLTALLAAYYFSIYEDISGYSGLLYILFGWIVTQVGSLMIMGVYEQRTRSWFFRFLLPLIYLWAAALILLILVATLGSKTFWLPPERLAFQNEAPFTGYVLKASEDHLIILNDRPRIIIERPKATLQDRDFCYPDDHTARSSKLAADSPVCP